MLKFFKNIDALLITNPTNIRYLTGFVGATPEERESYVLITQNKAFLFTNSLYMEQAQKLALPNCCIITLLKIKKPLEIVEISRENPLAKELASVLKRSHLASQGETLRGTRLGFEADNLKVSEFNRILKHLPAGKAGVQDGEGRITLIPTKNCIENMRMIKREDEIENIREAARLTDECFTYILSKLKPASRRRGSASRGGPGLTESEIAWEIESFIRTRDAQLAFSPIVAFGKHSSQPHYQTDNDSRLTVNDIVLLDFGARVNGYCADMTRVVFIGKPKDEWLRAYQTVLRAQDAVMNYLRAQGPALSSQLFGKKADQLARTIIKEAGYSPYPHSLGHGVGLDIHEAPRLTYKKNAILKPGMVVTVEPGIYIEGQYGIRIEDLVLLKKGEVEILSKSGKNLIIL